jgi:hypothetical protein
MPTLNEQWSAALHARMRDDVVAKQLVQTLSGVSRPADVIVQIQQFCAGRDLSESVLNGLLFTIDLAALLSNDFQPAFTILSDSTIAGLPDVAQRHYQTTSPFDPYPGFGQALLRQAPTAAVLGALRAGVIKHKTDFAQQLAIAFLQRAWASGMNFGRTRVTDSIRQDAEVQKTTASAQQAVVTFLEDIQRLVPLVEDLRHIHYLLAAGFTSARAIAATDNFITVISTSTGLAASAAEQIRGRATPIARRNEEAWVSYVQSRTNIPVMAVEGSVVGTTAAAPTTGRINLHNLFGDIDYTEVDEYTSVLSPAAYFVDLLELLRYAFVDPNDSTKGSLRKALLVRRPDLAYLQLSKANTLNVVPYIDLAIEIMETVIDVDMFGAPAILRTDAEEEEEEDSEEEEEDDSEEEEEEEVEEEKQETAKDLPEAESTTLLTPNGMKVFNEAYLTQPSNAGAGEARIANIQWRVYQNDKFQRVVTPLSQAPFDLAQTTLHELLEVAGHSTVDLFRLFQGRDRLRRNVQIADDSAAYGVVKHVLARRATAEALGLSHQDFVAVTQESFFSPNALRFLGSVKGVSITNGADKAAVDKIFPLPSAGQLWGYTNDKTSSADDKLAGNIEGVEGLTNIKSQLLPRAGISFDELSLILNTEYIGRELVIAGQNSQGLFAERLQDMRLEQAPQLYDERVLQPHRMHRFQAFVRLWTKLGWSICDTDAAIMTLHLAPLAVDRRPDSVVINPQMLADLAAIRKIVTLTDQKPSSLLVLWGDLRTAAPGSFYQTIFMNARLLSHYPGLHVNKMRNDDDPTTVGELQVAIQAGLGITQPEFTAFLSVAAVQLTEKWSVAAISAICRHKVLCEILQLDVETYKQWYAASTQIQTMLASPQRTLEVLEQWNSLHKNDIGSEWLLSTLSTQEGVVLEQRSVAFAARLVAAAASTRQKYAVAGDSQDDSGLIFSYPSERAAQACLEMFGSDLSASVSKVVELLPIHVVKLVEPLSIPKEIQGSIVQNKLQLELRTLLDQTQQESLRKVPTSNGDDVAAVSSVLEFNDLCTQRLRALLKGWAVSADVLTKLIFSTPPPRATDEAELELQLARRRRKFLEALAPQLIDSANAAVSHKILAEACADVTGPAMAVLSQNVGSILSSTPPVVGNMSDWLLEENTRAAASLGVDFTGFFIANSAGTYQFSCATESTAVIDGKASTPDAPLTLKLLESQACSLAVTGPKGLSSITVTSPEGTLTPLSSSSVLAQSVAAAVARIIRAGGVISGTVNNMKLSDGDIKALQLLQINLAKPAWTDLLLVQDYQRVRSLLGANKDVSLQRYLEQVANTELSMKTATAALVRTSLQDLLNSDGTRVDACIKQFFASHAVTNELYTGTRKWLRFLSIIMKMRAVANSTGLTVSLLAKWATVRSPTDLSVDYVTAKVATASICALAGGRASVAMERVAAKRREALIRYLLTLDNFKAMGDADDLFEHYLIDVQMGPQQQTSRIRQAISTVQLFIQRCLLGLELKNGIRADSIDLQKWEWMKKFTVWQANRKVFLFPENWAEPSLRDDKSQQFEAIEAAMLQTNLTKEKINALVRQYVYTSHEIADLEIISYFWESAKSASGTYHFFARTRTAPYIYYHREMKVSGTYMDASGTTEPEFLAEYNWYPWKRLEIEIPAYETDWTGTALGRVGNYLLPSLYRGRLFLFIPQILLKSQPQDIKKNEKTFEAFGKESKVKDAAPKNYWEVKMGWCECRNGVWSPKRISSSMLNVESEGAPPKISSFRFDIRVRSQGYNDPAKEASAKEEGQVQSESDDVLIIRVAHWALVGAKSTTKGVLKAAGKFEMRGLQMVALQEPPPPVVPAVTIGNTAPATASTTPTAKEIITLPTYFTSLSLNVDDTTEDKLQETLETYEEQYCLKTRPFLGLVPGIMAKDQWLTWNMSYNETQYAGATGLVVERKTDTHVESFFCVPKRGKNGQTVDETSTSDNYLRVMYTTSQALMENSTNTTELGPIFAVLRDTLYTRSSDTFGILGTGSARELASPFSIYNWELGFHLILLLMERLLATQQFELGLEVASMVFDPRAAQGTTPNKNDQSPLDQCWRFAPFQRSKLRLGGSVRAAINALLPGPKNSNIIENWLSNPFNAHSIGRGRPAVYMKRFMTKYIELLIAKGDEYFRQDSLETLPLALQQYVEASHCFGPTPVALPSGTKPVIKTYHDLESDINSFGTAKVDLELSFPFLVNIGTAKVDPNSKGVYNGVLGMVRSGYFSIPPNPQFVALRQLIDDRLYKLRNSLDMNGNPRRLALFDPPIDPAQLVRAFAPGGGGMAGFAASISGPMPNYRFIYLLGKAFEMCAELRGLADAYLTIKEKKDSEKMSLLRASQDSARDSLTLELKRMQKEESVKSREVLLDTRSAHVMKLSYYLALIGEPESKVPSQTTAWEDVQQVIGTPTKDELVMSPEEALEQLKTDEAGNLGDVVEAMQRTAAVLKALPNLESDAQPLGVGVSIKFDAGNVAEGMELVCMAFEAAASAKQDEASRAARKGQMIRQLQERRLQANSIGRDIKNTDLQLQAQELRIKMSDIEIAAHQKQTADNIETLEFMRSKYTAESLYAFMDASMRNLLFDTYLLAMDIAKSAEKAYMYERGPIQSAGNVLAASYWDNGRDGAFAAQNLYLGLKRIETSYQKSRFHDYELRKDVSLRQLDPWALQRFRKKGRAEFSIPEYLFDMDFPGQYCRRVKAVSVTIPCVAGPYTTVACTLKLLSHCYRLEQGGSKDYYPATIETDTRYRTDGVPITSIAMSTGRQDDGQFEASFQGERYGPFEGAGAISAWMIQLPQEVRQFDYESISDVVLQLSYTSREGGAGWAKAATNAVVGLQKSLQNRSFTSSVELLPTSGRELTAPTEGAALSLKQLRRYLPFWAQGSKITINKAWLLGPNGVLEKSKPTLNTLPLTPATERAGDMDVVNVAPGNYKWTDVEVFVPQTGLNAFGGKPLILLISYGLD